MNMLAPEIFANTLPSNFPPDEEMSPGKGLISSGREGVPSFAMTTRPPFTH